MPAGICAAEGAPPEALSPQKHGKTVGGPTFGAGLLERTSILGELKRRQPRETDSSAAPRLVSPPPPNLVLCSLSGFKHIQLILLTQAQDPPRPVSGRTFKHPPPACSLPASQAPGVPPSHPEWTSPSSSYPVPLPSQRGQKAQVSRQCTGLARGRRQGALLTRCGERKTEDGPVLQRLEAKSLSLE